MGAEEPLHVLTKTDLANHEKTKQELTEKQKQEWKPKNWICVIETENLTFQF